MKTRIVDAFADRPFTGNPASVCLLESTEWPPTTWMELVGREMNQPMTAFARPPVRDGVPWGLRWFNGAGREAAFCGHATLATAHALFDEGLARGRVSFETCAGLLSARAQPDGRVTLDFPAATLVEIAVPDRLGDALGGPRPATAYTTGSLRDLLVVLDSEADVRHLTPDWTILAQIADACDVRGVIATALADHRADYDFVSRFFAPRETYLEDAVTGSAHTALAPFWSARLGRIRLCAVQVSQRGGRIDTEVDSDRVCLTGRAFTILEGLLAEPSQEPAIAARTS